MGRLGRGFCAGGSAGDFEVPGYGRMALVGAVLAAGLGVAGLRAQTVLGDPRDAARTFASNCSACHKSPRGLAKSGQVAGFLRQHYTTGPEMSAAMAAYLVAAGAAPPEKKSAGKDDSAASAKKGKKDQLAATPSAAEAERAQQRTLRGKQRHPPQDEPAPAVQQQTAVPEPAQSPQQVATSPASPAQPAPVATAAAPSQLPPMVLDIPLPPMPEGPPADLTQSAFSSSPLP